MDVEETEAPEAGFIGPIDGEPNVDYLRSADAVAAEDNLLDVLNQPGDAP